MRVLIWDLPVRVFHWLFTAGWIGALAIALLASRSSLVFPYHSLIGLVLAFMLVLRIVWGFAGTRHARFGSFVFGPRNVLGYFKRALTWKETRWTGHNPGSAYVIFGMLALTAAQVVTGLMVGGGDRGWKKIHELLAYGMLALIAVHVLGIILHTLRHRDAIALSMISGRKPGEARDAIASSRPVVAAIFLVLIAAWAVTLYRNYNPRRQSTQLPFVGVEVPIGGSEEE